VRTTTTPTSHEQDYKELTPALYEAACFLGWRGFRSVLWCPRHVISMGLACKHCLLKCPECSCVGGPIFDAVKGEVGEPS
jgi:hypothetical protein